MQGTTTRYVLGFDAECSFCEEVAQEIRSRFGSQLELRDLRDPEMEAWRREALGEDPTWTPVLVKISGEQTRVYAGYRLGLALAWRFGPVATWRLTKALGELRDEKEQAASGTYITRSQFVSGMTKAVAGMALALSVFGSSRADAQEVTTESFCTWYACHHCYRRCGRRCASCDCVRRCKEAINCDPVGNCRCRARYC